MNKLYLDIFFWLCFSFAFYASMNITLNIGILSKTLTCKYGARFFFNTNFIMQKKYLNKFLNQILEVYGSQPPLLSQTELFIVSKSGERRKSPLSSHCAKVGKHNDVWDKCYLKGMLSRWKRVIYLNRSTDAVNDLILTHCIMQYWWS